MPNNGGKYKISKDVIKKHLDKMHEILDRCKAQRASWGLYFGYEIVD